MSILLLIILVLACCYFLPRLLCFFPIFIKAFFFLIHDNIVSFRNRKSHIQYFKPFGLKMFTGRQGSGKTIGMVYYLSIIKKKYPNCLIYTNFGYLNEDGCISSLNDLLTLKNGSDGIVFAFDELQNEFSSAASKDFPESILSLVTQQRKQRICILATSQVFTRVAKPLREQCFEVIECRTFFGRLTRLRSYDAADYNSIIDSVDPKKKFKLPKKWQISFAQTDELRDCYDTYQVVQRLSRTGFK